METNCSWEVEGRSEQGGTEPLEVLAGLVVNVAQHRRGLFAQETYRNRYSMLEHVFYQTNGRLSCSIV